MNFWANLMLFSAGVAERSMCFWSAGGPGQSMSAHRDTQRKVARRDGEKSWPHNVVCVT